MSFKVTNIEGDDNMKGRWVKDEKPSTKENIDELQEEVQRKEEDERAQVERQKEVKSEEREEKPKDPSQPSDDNPDESKPSFDVKEVFGDGFESVDDVKERLSKYEEYKARVESVEGKVVDDEELLKLYEAKKKGWSAEEYWALTKKDFDSASDEDVIKELMRLEKPHLDAEDIDVLYERNYKIDEDVDDEGDVRFKKLQLKDAAASARAKLKSHQAEYKPKAVQQRETQERAKEYWRDAAGGFNIDEIRVERGENDAVTYKVPQEVVEQVKGELTEIDNYFRSYVKEDGNLDVKRILEDRVKLKVFEDVVKAGATYSESKGREEVVERRNNVTTNPDKKNPQVNKKGSVNQQIYDGLKKAGL